MTDETEKDDDKFVPWFNLKSDPYTIPEEFAHELAAIVVQWGSFEMSLVSDTSTMMAYPNVRELAKEAPRSFTRKIELWKRCTNTLYPTVDLYRNSAKEICSKGKAISKHRNRLIHGTWNPLNESEPGDFRIVSYTGLEYVDEMTDLIVDLAYVKALHADICVLNDALYSLIANKMMHAHMGLLTAKPAP